MCNKTVHQNRTGVVLYGFKYDSGVLQGGDFTALVPCLRGEHDLPIPDAKEGLAPEALERVFDMGMYCFQKATFFHRLHHFPATLLTALLVCAFIPRAARRSASRHSLFSDAQNKTQKSQEAYAARHGPDEPIPFDALMYDIGPLVQKVRRAGLTRSSTSSSRSCRAR